MVYSAYQDDNKDRSPSMYNFMSGNSSDILHKKKDEETNFMVAENPNLHVTSAGGGNTSSDKATVTIPEEKQGFIDYEKEETNEATGDGNKSDLNINHESLDDDLGDTKKSLETKQENDKSADKVDSVFLKPPASQLKPQSAASNSEDEDCGIKCLYYTLQCCDCVLM